MYDNEVGWVCHKDSYVICVSHDYCASRTMSYLDTMQIILQYAEEWVQT